MFSWKHLISTNIVSAARTKLTLGDPYLKYPHYYFCSFQKSGRTWLRFILGNYLNIKFELGLDLNFHNIYTVLPSLTEKEKIAESYQLFVPLNTPLLFFTHSRYNPFLFRKDKVLFMLRSVYDTMVSFYFHNSKHHQRYEKGIKSFIKEPNLGVPRWINYMNSWAPRLLLGNCFIITYEKLYEKPVESVNDILIFLNIPPEISIIRQALDLSSFGKMKKIEIKDGIINHNYDRNDNNARRIRKGEIGAYNNYLDNDDIQYIQHQLDINLRNKAKELLLKNEIILL